MGLLLASWLIDVLHLLLPEGVQPLLVLRLDGAVVAFTALSTLGAGVLFALVPALRLSASAGDGLLHARSVGLPDRRRLGDALVGLNVALALMLLIGAGLTARSLQHLLRWTLASGPRAPSASPSTFPPAPGRRSS